MGFREVLKRDTLDAWLSYLEVEWMEHPGVWVIDTRLWIRPVKSIACGPMQGSNVTGSLYHMSIRVPPIIMLLFCCVGSSHLRLNTPKK